jgi:hypothetical protein
MLYIVQVNMFSRACIGYMLRLATIYWLNIYRLVILYSVPVDQYLQLMLDSLKHSLLMICQFI